MGDAVDAVDAVYTYIDGADPGWRAGYADITGSPPASDIRFGDHGELALSIRLLLRHCGEWVRRIYVVCGDSGISAETLWKIEPLVGPDRLWVVPQSDLLDRPSWSSCEVEAVLHRLPGITPHFLYMNDDMGFARKIPRALFLGPPVRLDAARCSSRVANLAQQHSQNSYQLFKLRFPASPIPPVEAPHFPSMMTVRGGEQMWAWFGAELGTMEPVRTLRTYNTQLLNILVSAHLGLGELRTQAHTKGVSRVLAEDNPWMIAKLRPHVYCINGIRDRADFARFTRTMLQARKTPPVKVLSSCCPPSSGGDDRPTGVREFRRRPEWVDDEGFWS